MATTCKGFLNIYRSGWFHRMGKPNCLDRHAGDLYETREAALADIEPKSHYVDTVPVEWVDNEAQAANPFDAVPVALSVTRKAHHLSAAV